jgi:hypothetical protein
VAIRWAVPASLGVLVSNGISAATPLAPVRHGSPGLDVSGGWGLLREVRLMGADTFASSWRIEALRPIMIRRLPVQGGPAFVDLLVEGVPVQVAGTARELDPDAYTSTAVLQIPHRDQWRLLLESDPESNGGVWWVHAVLANQPVNVPAMLFDDPEVPSWWDCDPDRRYTPVPF